MASSIDLVGTAKPALKALAKATGTPIVIQCALPLDHALMDAAKATLNGICPGDCTPACWEMARPVIILMPDGSEKVGPLFFQCQCVDAVGDPCVETQAASAP
jgi:hypothetical protein